MDKNWLIRTKSNHILGPISKEKVLELYHNSSIKPDDEICSGNGYWFFLREQELVDRFLLGSEVQCFNPISEAKNVLTQFANPPTKSSENEDITLVGEINLADLKKAESAPPEEKEKNLEPVTLVQKAEAKKKEVTKNIRKNEGTLKPQVQPIKRQDWLKYVAIIGFIILFLMIYYRKKIIKHVFQGEISTISVLNSAIAQDKIPEKKNY